MNKSSLYQAIILSVQFFLSFFFESAKSAAWNVFSLVRYRPVKLSFRRFVFFSISAWIPKRIVYQGQRKMVPANHQNIVLLSGKKPV
jgi:hypothetical protein